MRPSVFVRPVFVRQYDSEQTSERSGYSPMTNAIEIQSAIVKQLARREMGALSLVVSLRRTLSLGHRQVDLLTSVKSALKTLVTSNAVVDDDGRYSLARRK
jgi:hypothetical protein